MGPEQPFTPENQFFRRSEVGEAMEPRSSIDRLPEMMGFVETRELSELRNSVVEALGRGEEARDLQAHYHLLAEAVIYELGNDARPRARIGLIVQMGIMRRDGGSQTEYREELEDALSQAGVVGIESAEEIIREALIEDAIEGLRLLGLGEEEFLMAVFTEAAEIGLEDPESYLRAKGLLEG
jgi:hypothetical protein